MNSTENDNSLNQIGDTIGSEHVEVSIETEEALLGDNISYQEHNESPGEEIADDPGALLNSTTESRSNSRPPTGDNFRRADERMETDPAIPPTAYIKPHSAVMMTSQEQLAPVFRAGFDLLTSINAANDRGATELLPGKIMQSIRSTLHFVTKQIHQLTSDTTGRHHPATQPRNRSSMCRQCANPWPCNNTSCSAWNHAEKVKKEKAKRRAAAKERSIVTSWPTETKKSPTHAGLKWVPVDEQGNVYRIRKTSSKAPTSRLSKMTLQNGSVKKRNSYVPVRQHRKSESGYVSPDEPRSEQDMQRGPKNSGNVSPDEPRIIKEVRRDHESGYIPLDGSGPDRKMENISQRHIRQNSLQLQPQR